MALADSDAGFFDGYGYGRPPAGPFGFGGPLGGFGPGPFGAAPGAFGGGPYGPVGGAFGGGPYGPVGGAFGGGPYGPVGGAFGGAPYGPAGGFGPGFGGAPFGAFGRAPGAFYGAPANYQFGYGVQTADLFGPADFGHNEERTPLGTVGRYHVNTPGSFQFVNYNIAGLGGPAYGGAPFPAFG
jgi:hypothetical protein